MSYSCKILLDSISETGKRLTTFEITFPRIVLAEFNTHRMFSRNSASSRAIPFKKQIERVARNPFIPERFPIDGKGMQPNSYIDNSHRYYDGLVAEWLNCRDSALSSAKDLYDGVFGDLNEGEENLQHIHKQLVNRLLESFMWHTVIVTATEFSNFFKLRTHSDAQHEIRKIADLMYEAYHAFDDIWVDAPAEIYGGGELDLNKRIIDGAEWKAIHPQKLKVGEWHCPLVYNEDYALIIDFLTKNNTKLGHNRLEDAVIQVRKEIAVARCARVSYLTHDGKRDIEADLNLFEKLRTSGHWSPFEHIATPYFIDKDHPSKEEIKVYPEGKLHFDNQNVEGYVCFDRNGYYGFDLRSGNFIGWKQFRKEFADENCTNFKKEEN